MGKMDLQKTKDSADSSEGEHGSSFEKLGEQGKNKSRFQLALEVEDLFEEQRPKRSQACATFKRSANAPKKHNPLNHYELYFPNL